MHQLETVSDEELIQRIITRNERAFEILFERYVDALHRHAVCILHDETAAHDIVQEVFVRVWSRAAQWRGEGLFQAWLYRTATNLALNQLRTVRRRREVSLEIPIDPDDEDETTFRNPAWTIESPSMGPEALVEFSEERARNAATYQCLVKGLPDDKREVFRMVHEMEMSLRDTANVLDIPEGTVKSRLHYARKTLAHEWKALEGGE